MKITLVYPSYGNRSHSRYFPFGLAYVAACLLKAGHSVTVVDMEGDGLSLTDAVKRTADSSPKVVAFGGMVTRFRFIKQLAAGIRRELPGVFMLAGNSGATTVPEIYLKSCGLNCVVMGEGEVTSVELMRNLEEGTDWHSAPGLAWLDENDELKKSPPREMIQKLDSIPWPAWDLFPVENYISSLDHRQKKVRHMEVLASRGCPYNCVYCYRIYGRKVRRRSPESIIAEIKELVRRYDIGYSGFPDDLFTSDRDFVMKTCTLLKEELPGLKWSCLGRVNTIDKEMLLSMKDAGCDWISYGIESGCDDMLKRMRRGVTAKQCLEAVKLTESVGIHADGSFIIGMFGETRDSVGKTVEFCRKADITAPMLFVTPYPGTAIFKTALEQGRIPYVEKFLTEMNSADSLLVNLTEFTDRELVGLRDWAQGTIGRNYLLKKPFTRIPALLVKHFKLRGFMGLIHDIRAFLTSLLRRK